MITIDLHTHTNYSHAAHSPKEMFDSAMAKGLSLIGFSEHSPRPHGYNYTREYRERLARLFPEYIREVTALKEQNPDKVMVGLEMDWMNGEEEFVAQSIAAHDYDYVLGSVHFLKTWGYDDDPGDWHEVDEKIFSARYEEYFRTMAKMAASGFFQIASHPDLIKIFSVEIFRRWLDMPYSLDLVRDALKAIKDAGMSMEISSAGLRKMCKEIYPGPKIMALAADVGVPISFGSDAHRVEDVGYGFDQLAAYAASFGYKNSVWFCKGECFIHNF